ncbi:glycosyltransferase, partial [Streptomyces sp. NPDC127084]|uniref:glycosyltransferase n=1 Tax=Streptomyces sp. NPDC127084 TaxID=3347133 RepID=UPI00364FCE1D
MSLPLTRRIARAALLVAAGAAPVVGAAGSASAVDLAPTHDLGGGLTQLDGVAVGDATDGTAQKATATAQEAGGKLVGTALPVARGTFAETARTGAPAVQETAGQAVDSSTALMGETGATAVSQGLPAAEALAAGVPDAGTTLPADALPADPMATTPIPAHTLPAPGLPTDTLPAATPAVPAAPLPESVLPATPAVPGAPVSVLPVDSLPETGLPAARVIGETQIVAAADRLIANTAEEADELVRHYAADPAKVAVVHPGVNLERFRPADGRAAARARLG